MNKLFPLALGGALLTAPASAQISSFQHIILVVQENRTPDNMFQWLPRHEQPERMQHAADQQTIQHPNSDGWLVRQQRRRAA